MNTTVPTPPAVGSVHTSSLVVSMKAAYAENIRQVTVAFVSYDHVRISSIHLDVAAAAALAEQLTDAVRVAEHDQDQQLGPRDAGSGAGDVVAEFDRNRASK